MFTVAPVNGALVLVMDPSVMKEAPGPAEKKSEVGEHQAGQDFDFSFLSLSLLFYR